MSKFVSYFPIGSMSGDSAYLGLAPDSVKGRVISTLDQNIVYRIELSSQKTIQSWTSEQKFSHKVVYDFKSGKYVGIFGNQKLVSWGEGTTKIEKGKIKLPRMLKDIVSFDNKHTILVYKDGTCESLESRENGCNVQCKPVISPQTHQISQIACFNTRDNRVMLTYFVNSRRNRSKLELVYFLLNDDDLTPSRSNDNVARVKRIEITNDEKTLSGYTVVDGDTFPSVIKIGLDKRIYMLPLNCDENAPSGFGAHNATFNYLRVDKPLTVINVSPNCIAIYGGNAKKDGASLILYNTVHFTVVCVQEFKVHLNNCRLWSIGKRILMADGHQLSCVLFSMSQGKLSEVIGSKRSNEWDHKVNKEGVNEEDSLVEVASFVDGAPRVIDASPNLTLNKKMFRRDAIPTAIFEDVEKNIERMTRFDIPIEFVDGVDHDLKVRTFVHPKDELYAYNQNRILSDFLENGGASEIEITEHHIQILIKAKASSELVKCLRKYTNVSERMLVKCLKYFLSMADDDEKLTNINVLFTCSFDSKLIVNHLSTDLNLDDAIYLLDVIHRNLIDDEFSLEEAPQFGQRFDGDMALINWFVVILEAHYSNFLLSRDPNLNQFLSNWKELIETFVSDIRSLKEVDAKLLSLVNGKFKRNDNTSSKWYSVERVKLY